MSRDADFVRTRGITPTQIVNFLIREGWKRVEHPNDKIDVYAGSSDDEGKPIEVAFPRDVAYRDFYERAGEVLKTLSVLTGKSLEDVTRVMTGLVRGRVLARVVSMGNDVLDSISLPIAEQCISELRATMGFAAMVENQPKAYYGKTSSVGTEFVKECRFGHTFHGSFGFSVESPPIQVSSEEPESDDTSPGFARRVVERIAIGIDQVEQADASDAGALPIDSYRTGFNGNICESLAKFSAFPAGTGVELSVSFSGVTPKKSPALNARPLQLNEKTIDKLKRTAERMRQDRKRLPSWYMGRVLDLKSSLSNEGELSKHTAIFVYLFGPGVKAKVHVDAEEYRKASAANLASRTVFLFGTLEKIGARYQIRDAGPMQYEQPEGWSDASTI